MNNFMAFAIAAALGAAAVPASAQDAQIDDLVDAPLATAEDARLMVKRYDVPGGWVTPPHSHTGHVVIYVVEGRAVIELDGESSPIMAGDALQAMPDARMVMSNSSEADRLVFLLHQVGPEGAGYIRPAE